MSTSGEIGVPKGGGNKCSFTGCDRSKRKFPSLHFFKFPVSRKDICDEWVFNCANETISSLPSVTLKHRIVCEKHFTTECFTSTIKTRLKTRAVPTLLSVEDDNKSPESPEPESVERTPGPAFRRSLFESPSTSSPNNLDQDRDSVITTPIYKRLKSVNGRKPTPRKSVTPRSSRLLALKLQKALKQTKMYKQKVKRLSSKSIKPITKEQLLCGAKEYLPPEVYKFFKMQINHAQQKDKKLPFNSDERRQALLFRYRSPAMYEELRSKGFSLPSRSTISRWLGEIELRPGIFTELFQQIKTKIESMSSYEKQAVILFDGMVIKKNLEYECKQDVIEGK